MAWTIGIFEREDQVLDAARELRARGNDRGSLLAVVNNEENAPLLSVQNELPLEGLAGMKEAADRSNQFRDGDDWIDEGVEIPAALSLNSIQGAGMNGQGAAFAAYTMSHSDELGTAASLERIGLPEKAAQSCASSVDAGKLLLLADTDSMEETTRLMRSCGAADVVHESG